MRSYEEISERIMRRGDEITEARRARAVKIKHTSYAVSGMCAAVIAGVGIWRVASSKDPRGDEFNGSSIITDTEPATVSTASSTTSAAVTTTAAATVSTAGKTTQTTASAQPSGDNKTTQLSTGTTAAPNTTRSLTTALTTKAAETVTTATQTTVTEQEALSETTTPADEPTGPTSVIDTSLGSRFSEIVLASPQESNDPSNPEGGERYIYKSFDMNRSMLDEYLGSARISTEYTKNGELVTEEADIDIYSIKNISSGAVIAVRFKGREGVYYYLSKTYQPVSISSMINDLAMTADGVSQEINIAGKSYNAANTDRIWEILTENTELPNVYKQVTENSIIAVPKLTFNYRLPQLRLISGTIIISENGYLYTNIGYLPPYFYIGEDKVQELTDHITANDTSP